jgi:hypothetical protein
MRFLRRLRSRARVAISATALALALGVPCASASASTTPATAVSGDTVYAAWSAHALVQIAHREPGGRWSRAVAVGRTVGDDSPQLAVDARGDQMMVWQSESVLRSAFLRAGESTWTVETVAFPGFPAAATLVMDARGRATVAWTEVDGSRAFGRLLVRSTDSRGAWEAPVEIADGVDGGSASMAIDAEGDIVLAYAIGQAPNLTPGLWATTLVAGTTAWPAAVTLPSPGESLRVVAGGARTFVASWVRRVGLVPMPPYFLAYYDQSVEVARMLAPGAWSEPESLFPVKNVAVPLKPEVRLFPLASAVDALGNATTVSQIPTDAGPIAATRLPASGETSSAPEELGVRVVSSSPYPLPAVASGGDGTTTVAFLRIGPRSVDLRTVTAPGVLGRWGEEADAVVGTCPAVRWCPDSWSFIAPAVVATGSVTSVLVHTPARVVAITRSMPTAPWSQPETLQAADTTNVYLSSAKVKRGAVQVMATCALPPCRGTAVLRVAGTSRVLGHASLTIARSVTVSRRIVLSRWARARIAGGARLHTQLTFGARTGDGTREQADMTILLHA